MFILCVIFRCLIYFGVLYCRSHDLRGVCLMEWICVDSGALECLDCLLHNCTRALAPRQGNKYVKTASDYYGYIQTCYCVSWIPKWTWGASWTFVCIVSFNVTFFCGFYLFVPVDLHPDTQELDRSEIRTQILLATASSQLNSKHSFTHMLNQVRDTYRATHTSPHTVHVMLVYNGWATEQRLVVKCIIEYTIW